MNAYENKYLDETRKVVGELFDAGIRGLKLEEDFFASLFVKSPVSAALGKGEVSTMEVTSGSELCIKMLADLGIEGTLPSSFVPMEESQASWAGRVLASYQWQSGRTFRQIIENVSFSDIYGSYVLFKNVAESQFFDRMDDLLKGTYQETNLKRLREKAGLTQVELSEKAQVKIRSIQMYEQRKNDIDKAQANYLYRISKILGCAIEDLLEHPSIVTERGLKEA